MTEIEQLKLELAECRRCFREYMALQERRVLPEGRAIEILREVKGGIPPWLHEYKIIDEFLASLPPQGEQ